MLIIHHPEIIERGNDIILQAKFQSEDKEDILWFSTKKDFGKYFCHERGDAFLVAMLLYAMKRGENIHILAPISERLYYTLTKHFIKVIADVFPGYHRIQIFGNVDPKPLKNAGGVGTGFSCGVDSFCTVIEHFEISCPATYKITHLAFFNVGASGDYGGDHSRNLFNKRIEEVRLCAEDLNIPLVTLDSNISEILELEYEPTHTIRNVAAVLSLQKLFTIYYYSSSHGIHQFQLNSAGSGYYDLFTLNMLSTETISFYSSGEIYSRFQKTDIISNYSLSYKYLNVCFIAEKNCSRCRKCIRTLVSLDLLGKLDHYDKVFDLIDYQTNRSRYLGLIMCERKKDDLFQEVYIEMKRKKFYFPIGAYFYYFLTESESVLRNFFDFIIKRSK